MRLCDCEYCRHNGRSLGTRYPPGLGQIWLDNVRCRGNETHIGSCRHMGWGYHNCGHHEDVSISCTNDSLTAAPRTTLPPNGKGLTVCCQCLFHVRLTSLALKITKGTYYVNKDISSFKFDDNVEVDMTRTVYKEV